MPLTKIQEEIAKLLSHNRTEDSHLAGGAALHIRPNSLRYSNDLDYFNDSDERVAKAYELDERTLIENSFEIDLELRQPGYIRVQVIKNGKSTKVEWAHDSAWRFMPPTKDTSCGYRLHPIDLAINKVLTLAGRNEARDFLDVVHVHEDILPLGALCWAAVGKDPGFNPHSLLELLKRRGKFQQEDFDRLHLKKKVGLQDLKTRWLHAVADAEKFIESRPAEEVGCLYVSTQTKTFYEPKDSDRKEIHYKLHFGVPGGVLPSFFG